MTFDFGPIRDRWNQQAEAEEAWLGRPSFNRALRWREIERHLAGVRTILDVGGATGAFSIPLAERGFEVTHVDFAPAMLEKARSKAAHLSTIQFVEANAAALTDFPDASFDLVLNMDGPLAASGPLAETVLAESCRVARHKVICSTAHRAWMVAELLEACVEETETLLPGLFHLLRHGDWNAGQFPENAHLKESFSFASLRTFLPAELRHLLEQQGFTVLRSGPVGTLVTLLSKVVRQRILASPILCEQFLDVCEEFDREVLPGGTGSPDDTGLLAVAKRPASGF